MEIQHLHVKTYEVKRVLPKIPDERWSGNLLLLLFPIQLWVHRQNLASSRGGGGAGESERELERDLSPPIILSTSFEDEQKKGKESSRVPPFPSLHRLN